MFFYVALGAFAGVVVCGLLLIILGLKGGPWKLPGIGMAVCFVVLIASAVLLNLGGGDTDDPGTADHPSGAVESGEPGDSASDEVSGWDGLGGVDVDPGLFSVTLTIPSDYIDAGTTQESLDATAKEEGYKSATLNSDGSVTYIMTKAQHREMMSGISQGINDSLAEIANSEEYPTIKKIEANSDYTQYKVYLSSDKVGVSESMATFGLYIFSGTYHIFNGTEPGNVNIQFINEATGEVIESANSRDMQ